MDTKTNTPAGLLERRFALAARGTNVRTEVLAGVTTFLTMAYILFVNPAILGDAGMDKGAVFVATCLASAAGTLIMALVADMPIALAPGMGLNAYFAYVVVGQMHWSWQAALGAVFLSGCGFLLVTALRLRDLLLAGIPGALRIGITVGIGLFLSFIALKNAGLVVADKATLVTLGDPRAPGPLLAILGFFVIATLAAMRVRGAILVGILLVTAASFIVGGNAFHGIVSAPPSLRPTLFALDIRGALSHGILDVVLVFFLVELFDATGTLLAVANRAGLLAEDGDTAPLGRALLADSGAILVGAMLGTSSTTAYIESAAGVAEGGRTGLVAIVVASLFLAALVLAPLAGAVPAYATAPALLYVGCLMMREIGDLSFDDATEAIPAVVTAVAMPFTFSIANGIAFGFVSYAVLKIGTGRIARVHPVVWIVALLFVVRFAWLGPA